MLPITRKGVRILRPAEYEQLLTALNEREKAQFNGLLATGMRYIEAVRFQQHPEWLDGRFIRLPRGSVLKKRTEFEERTIMLSNWGQKVVPLFLLKANKLPSRNSWDWLLNDRAKKAGLEMAADGGLCAKTTRKTWESWLIATYPQAEGLIAASQGHTQTTQIKHYLGLGFYPEEIESMKKYVEGFLPSF